MNSQSMKMRPDTYTMASADTTSSTVSVEFHVNSEDGPVDVYLMTDKQVDAFKKADKAVGFWGKEKDYFESEYRAQNRYVVDIDHRLVCGGGKRLYLIVQNLDKKKSTKVTVSGREWHYI